MPRNERIRPDGAGMHRFGRAALALLLALSIVAVPAGAAADLPTLASVLADHAPSEGSEFLQAPGDLYFELHRVEVTSRVTYLGDHRPIDEERLHFLEAYFERSLKRSEWSTQYQEEILCVQGELRYWLPIQSTLLKYLVAETRAPTDLAVDVRLLGAYRARSGALVNVLIVTEFNEAE